MDHTGLPLHTTPYLPLPCERSPDGATLNGRHLIQLATHLLTPWKDERLSWPSWLTYSGCYTHISGHTSATDRAEVMESLPVRDRRSNHWATQPTSPSPSMLKTVNWNNAQYRSTSKLAYACWCLWQLFPVTSISTSNMVRWYYCNSSEKTCCQRFYGQWPYYLSARFQPTHHTRSRINHFWLVKAHVLKLTQMRPYQFSSPKCGQQQTINHSQLNVY